LGGVLVAIERPRMRTFGHRHAARQHHRRQGAVRAGVHDHVDLLRHEPPVAHDAGPMMDDRGVALGGGAQVLVAVVDHAHRLADLASQQRGMQRDHRGVLLLAAEAAARLRLDHDSLRIGQLQGSLQGSMDVVRALAGAVHRHPAVGLRDRDHGLVLDVELLLVPNPVGALDHQLRLGEPRLQVAPPHLEVRDLLGRLERVEDRRQAFGADLEVLLRGSQRFAMRGSEEAQCLGLVADLAANRHQDRLVVADQADDVVAGDAGGGDHHHLAPVECLVQLYCEEVGVRLGGTNRGTVPGTGEDQVIRVHGEAGELGRSLAAEGTADDDAPRRGAPRRDLQRVRDADLAGARRQDARHAALSSSPDDSTVPAVTGTDALGAMPALAASRCGRRRPPPAPH